MKAFTAPPPAVAADDFSTRLSDLMQTRGLSELHIFNADPCCRNIEDRHLDTSCPAGCLTRAPLSLRALPDD